MGKEREVVCERKAAYLYYLAKLCGWESLKEWFSVGVTLLRYDALVSWSADMFGSFASMGTIWDSPPAQVSLFLRDALESW